MKFILACTVYKVSRRLKSFPLADRINNTCTYPPECISHLSPLVFRPGHVQIIARS